jgi:thiol-disulfide isomerase/thioredoxin
MPTDPRPHRLLTILVAVAALLTATSGARAAEPPPAAAPSPAAATLTEVGQAAPPAVVTTLAGEHFDLAAQHGKVVLVNFWATWCPPCRAEMPHLRDQVWSRFGARDDFVLISIAREETAAVIAPFVAEHGYGWTFAPDPERKVYAGFAAAHIPRNYLIGRDGTILLQSVGFEQEEFDAMVARIAAELGDAAP